MALYDCECRDCRTRFEVRRSITENSPFLCPKCQGEARVILYPATVIYRGSGFYTTDNSSSHRGEPLPDTGKDDGEGPAE